MANYKLETSIPFPFFKINELVSYTEVKKPSGIAFMILVLLKESSNKKLKISAVLENFGVPTNLHYLFSNEIKELIRQRFLEMTDGSDFFDPNRFDSYAIEDIGFTPDGKKIFAEKSIPTGNNKEAKIPVYYNIALNELLFNIDNSLEPRPLMDSPITPEFMSKFEIKKDIESFLNKNKGTKVAIYENGKVSKYELIKQEEIITEIMEQSREDWIAKYDCTINLNGNACDFEFENKALQKFFETNYTNKMINDFIGRKNKFKFETAHVKNMRLEDFSNKDLIGIAIPKDLGSYLKQKGQLLITKGNYLSESYQNVIRNDKCLTVYDESCEFITVDQANNRIAYFPGVFFFDAGKNGAINIPLVAKTSVSEDELKQILSPFVETLKEYSEDNFRTLVKITKISKDYDKAYIIFSGYLKKDLENNIVILNEMKATALMDANILAKYKEKLKDSYVSYLKSVTEDKLPTALKITSSIPKFLGIASKDALSVIFASLGDINDKIKVYENLLSAGFDKTLVICFVNPVPDTLKAKSVEDKTLLDLKNFDSNVNEMKLLSGIKDYRSYVLDEENIDKEKFKKIFSTAKSLLNQISFLKTGNESLFNDYDVFMRIFRFINDDINMIQAALSNPKNIKKELITKKIDSGEYQFVLVNLSAKLESILKTQCKLSGKLSEMLSEARRSGAIDRKIATDLHDFREVRNSYTHIDAKTRDFEPNDLRRWCDEIFSLEEGEKK